ncbi:flagellar export protein FliJ [Geobacter sp. AOG2]|uniref:flagellar export protein FliJ n=1 Tax=Geobacter sp. AOG2 TaxID=1566347 RepID=UPI001CC69008|nr:flagellar export protein FliJ [Geobacter sp. AOG2]GFE59484.1 flagellar export protein FliJ [Geobacter sp. AOG2]
MKGNGFKLEQVLNYRCEIEKMRKQEFASAKREFEHADDRLRREKERVENVSEEFCHRQGELESIQEMRMYADFFARKREDLRNQKDRLDQLGTIMNDRRDFLLDATKDKKVLESLKEQKTKEFKLMMDHKEQTFLDEISIQKKGTKL